MGICLVLSPHYFQQMLLIFWHNVNIQSVLDTSSSISWCTKMAGLPDILTSHSHGVHPCTVFITHSVADLQWPKLAYLICPTHQDSSAARNTAVVENPAIADWFFHCRIEKFISAFYVDVLDAGSAMNDSTVAVVMCMVWYGFQIYLMWRRS